MSKSIMQEKRGGECYLCNMLSQEAAEDIQKAAGGQPAATWKNQQNGPFSQFNISQNIPAGFCFLEQRDPGKEVQ